MAEGDQCYPSTGDLVLGAGAVFWVTSVSIAGKAIRRTPLTGGATTTVRASASVAVDGQNVYWTEPKLQRIRKLSK